MRKHVVAPEFKTNKMAASDEEPDYMSEEFLNSCIPQDVRPGLSFNHRTQRQQQVERKRKAANEVHRKLHKPVKVLEAELREEGLGTAISTSSKGFSMLQKMGYSVGKGLGKTGEGRVEPVPVEIKTDRAGLGREAALKDLEERKQQMRKKKKERTSLEVSVEEFRARMRNQATLKQTMADLSRSQRVCETLDEKQNIERPAEMWFWPPVEKKDVEEVTEEAKSKDDSDRDESVDKRRKVEEEEEPEEDDDSFDPSEKLELLTNYLLTAHLYCIWCGTAFEDDDDMKNNCPGPSRDLH